MTGSVAALLRTVSAPSAPGLFHVRRLPGHPAYYVGRDASNNAAILIRASGSGRTLPLRLAGIEARFEVPCKVAEPGAPERTETLTAILCLSREPGMETYFASAAESLVAVLGAAPTTREVGEAVERLVELFQKLRNAPKRSLAGLVGELIVIWSARDTAAAVSAWRADPEDRYDFVCTTLRVDAKASTDRRRSHELSFEQANPPPGTAALLASVWVEAAGGGVSLREHLSAIETRLSGDHASTLRLRSIVADTLGETLLTAMEWRFDLAVATTSLSFFDMRAIPAIRAPLPEGVAGVRFVTDVRSVSQIDLAAVCSSLDSTARGLLPAI